MKGRSAFDPLFKPRPSARRFYALLRECSDTHHVCTALEEMLREIHPRRIGHVLKWLEDTARWLPAGMSPAEWWQRAIIASFSNRLPLLLEYLVGTHAGDMHASSSEYKYNALHPLLMYVAARVSSEWGPKGCDFYLDALRTLFNHPARAALELREPFAAAVLAGNVPVVRMLAPHHCHHWDVASAISTAIDHHYPSVLRELLALPSAPHTSNMDDCLEGALRPPHKDQALATVIVAAQEGKFIDNFAGEFHEHVEWIIALLLACDAHPALAGAIVRTIGHHISQIVKPLGEMSLLAIAMLQAPRSLLPLVLREGAYSREDSLRAITLWARDNLEHFPDYYAAAVLVYRHALVRADLTPLFSVAIAHDNVAFVRTFLDAGCYPPLEQLRALLVRLAPGPMRREIECGFIDP